MFNLQYSLTLAKDRFFKAIVQLLCNVIPITKWRIKARRNLMKIVINLYRTIPLKKVDSYLSKAILKQINAVDNEYFITQNTKIMTGGGGLSF